MGKRLLGILIAAQFVFAACLGGVPVVREKIFIKYGTPYYFDVRSYYIEDRRVSFRITGDTGAWKDKKLSLMENIDGQIYFSTSPAYSIDGKSYDINTDGMNYYFDKNYDFEKADLDEQVLYYSGYMSADNIYALGYVYNGKIIYTDLYINGVEIEDYIENALEESVL